MGIRCLQQPERPHAIHIIHRAELLRSFILEFPIGPHPSIAYNNAHLVISVHCRLNNIVRRLRHVTVVSHSLPTQGDYLGNNLIGLLLVDVVHDDISTPGAKQEAIGTAQTLATARHDCSAIVKAQLPAPLGGNLPKVGSGGSIVELGTEGITSKGTSLQGLAGVGHLLVPSLLRPLLGHCLQGSIAGLGIEIHKILICLPPKGPDRAPNPGMENARFGLASLVAEVSHSHRARMALLLQRLA
mmetsp:Transcript_77166/g.165399  ORF Transcript_77166/g.165399 Transcript_77166/m.165399 type:complete len:243 (-) Transcript_77166:1082-1810(-)